MGSCRICSGPVLVTVSGGEMWRSQKALCQVRGRNKPVGLGLIQLGAERASGHLAVLWYLCGGDQCDMDKLFTAVLGFM